MCNYPGNLFVFSPLFVKKFPEFEIPYLYKFYSVATLVNGNSHTDGTLNSSLNCNELTDN